MNGIVNRVKSQPPHSICCLLKCSQCGDLLSCDPVRYLPNNGAVCGRCARSQQLQSVRSLAFEDLANYFLYRCKNDRCNRLLDRQEVIAHEVKCDFRQGTVCACWRRCIADNPPSPADKGIYYVKADDKTHELITCAYCFGYLSNKPIFLRPNGTYTCYRCGPDLQAPPVLRDIPLEALLDCFIIKCSYRMNGCEERYKFGEEVVEHETTCRYNPRRQVAPKLPENPGGKIKGVISTISSGHIYATITPNHFYQKYGQTVDDTMRELQTPPSAAESQGPTRSSGHSRQESLDHSARSSISMDRHHWDVYTGDEGKNSDEEWKYMPKVQVKGIGVTRNESILYNNVVTEIKYKQKIKTPSHIVDEV